MVLCKYFQQGYCRFGSKCVNEHFDVKQILKTDMETALNGKQWPLSCYGPFKDKPCLPNFIEDMSFEEIRDMCYESKKKNYYAQFHRGFNQRVLAATEKLSALPTQQMIDVAVNIYDTPVQDAKPVSTIFGSAANNSTNNSNVFGSNVFNSNNNSNNAASATTGNIFTNSNSINTQINPFANSQQQQQQQQQQVQQQQQGNSIFAQAINANPVNTFSFANANNNSNNGNIFAQNENQKSGMGLFAQAAQQTANSVPGMNIFQQPQLQQQQQQQPNSSIFSQNVFQQAQPQPQPQPQQQQQQQPLMNKPFAQPMNAVGPQTGGNIFAQANQAQQNNNNSFGVNQQQQQQQQSQPMQNTEQAQPMAGSNALYSGVYSRLEDLTKDEIEAFQAPLFVPGKIPFSPPSREFVV